MGEYRHYLENINSAVSNNLLHYIHICERRYEDILRSIAEKVLLMQEDNKVIMLAGPSSSGKTTTANKLARSISRMGCNAYVISLDDFYIDRDKVPVGPDGLRDYETLDALNLELISECLDGITSAGKAKIPSFSFETGQRKDSVITLKLEPSDIVVVEGLHALNPIITGSLHKNSSITRVYISTASGIYYRDGKHAGELLFERREIRFLRRLIRDYYTRDSSVQNTYAMWPKVIGGEDRYLTPFKKLSDYSADTVHAYELCVYRDTAIRLLSELSPEHEKYAEAQDMIGRLSLFHGLDKAVVPRGSLLHEFTGEPLENGINIKGE